jgi:predicted AAA+ superfamily ATPase
MPEFKRSQLKTLRRRILEPRKFIQVLVGPRQVGKTRIINQLLSQKLIFTHSYSADDIIAVDSKWLDNVWAQLRLETHSRGEKNALLIIDEVQRIANWSQVVKKNWDLDTKNKINIKVILSGSSRLLLQQGLSESLLGRYELIRANHWSYLEMHQAFNFTSEQYVWFGGYPGIASEIGDESRFKKYLKDSIIEASINKDILMLTQINKPALLRRLFDLGIAYNAQILSYNKILGQLHDAGNTTTLAKYLELLDQAGLLSGLDVFSEKLMKIKSASPKFQVYNTALISALQIESFKQAQANQTLWGRLVESAVGAHLLNEVAQSVHTKLFYWREKIDGQDLEIDFIIHHGQKIIGFEVKSGQGKPNLNAITAFKKKFPHAHLLLVGDNGLKWQKFLKLSLEEIVAL